jgi:hypothetical protein
MTIRGESVQRLKSLDEIIVHQTSVQLFFQAVVRLVVILLHVGSYRVEYMWPWTSSPHGLRYSRR